MGCNLQNDLLISKHIGTFVSRIFTFDFAKTVLRNDIVWQNVIGFLVMHLMALYAIYVLIAHIKFLTFIWILFILILCQVGVTIGAHRLYTHRAFKATAPLRVFLLMCHTIAGENSLYFWARDHRQHHKYSDTDADQFNATRGFFFSHIGWLMTRKHPDVIKFGKTVDLSDLEADPFVMFQKKYYPPLYALFTLLLVMAPCYFWDETIWNSFLTVFMFRTVFVLNVTFLVNSAAHMYGTRPYDKSVLPSETWFVSYLSGGEGWHNFHHAYPWDYRASEFGPDRYNFNARVIEMFEKLGLASDLRSVSKSVLEKKVVMSGDGSHPVWGVDQNDSEQ